MAISNIVFPLRRRRCGAIEYGLGDREIADCHALHDRQRAPARCDVGFAGQYLADRTVEPMRKMIARYLPGPDPVRPGADVAHEVELVDHESLRGIEHVAVELISPAH